MSLHTELRHLWSLGGNPAALLDSLSFTDLGPSLPSTFQVATLAGSTIAAQALAAAAIWLQRSGQSQQVDISVRRALAMFRCERYLRIDGQPPADPWDPLAGFYQAGDGRWIQLHTNFSHHREGVLQVLGCANERPAVEAAIRTWKAADLDAALAAAGMCAAFVRTPEEWQREEQAKALARLPLMEIIRIGDAPPEPFAAGGLRPLDGIRVLDLSRVIAAPLAGRALAQHGAEVMAVGAAHLPNIPLLVIECGRGKRNVQLDLRRAEEAQSLKNLVRGADVWLQAYRPGSLAARGFGVEELSALRPGLVQVSLSAYGHEGPWQGRRGFDSLVQSATGIAFEAGQAAGLNGPGKLPCQALDHATGYLAAYGAMVALRRRAEEGGSWLVRVSLAQTGRWLQSLARVENGLSAPELSAEECAPWLEEVDSDFGRLTMLAPVEQMAATPAYFATAPRQAGADLPRWGT